MSTFEKRKTLSVWVESIGAFITAGLNDDGQPFVCINTEEAPKRYTALDGNPIICVLLNDATLYDLEKTP